VRQRRSSVLDVASAPAVSETTVSPSAALDGDRPGPSAEHAQVAAGGDERERDALGPKRGQRRVDGHPLGDPAQVDGQVGGKAHEAAGPDPHFVPARRARRSGHRGDLTPHLRERGRVTEHRELPGERRIEHAAGRPGGA